MKLKFLTRFALFVALFLTSLFTKASTYYLTISDSTKISSISVNYLGNYLISFTFTPLNTIVGNYTITNFEQAYSYSRQPHLRQIWKVESDSALALVSELRAADSVLFLDYYEYHEPKPLANFYPFDWGKWDDGYLEYINAPGAWGITHGSSFTLIGVLAEWFNSSHVDLQGKIALSNNTLTTHPTKSINHGLRVAGLAAGRTNDLGDSFPSIGFDCRLAMDGHGGPNINIDLARNFGALIQNMSYGDAQISPASFYNATEEDGYNEAYEEGAFLVAGAGNGPGRSSTSNFPIAPMAYEKCYPASYDNVFSVSGICWKESTGTFNKKGSFELNIGDHDFVMQYNDKVDLLAPAYFMGGLINTSPYYVDGIDGYDAGTSFAAPLVAGTAGLMRSVNPWLSPYQLEYILKTKANPDVLSQTENLYYAGKLGAGALDAKAAVTNALTFDVNKLDLQTLYIKGVEISTLCAPTFSSNSIYPELTAIVENGAGTITYRWEEMPGNTCTLDYYDIANPTIIASTAINNEHVAKLRLVVTDQSTVQKVARRIFTMKLRTANESDLTVRDSYMDMMNEPNTQFSLNRRDWGFWESPDLWVRKRADNGYVHQDPEYFQNDPNEIYVRVRNIGCAKYDPLVLPTIGAQAEIYWTKASTGERWTMDWNGSYQIGGHSGLVDVGGHIADIGVPELEPGQSVVLSTSWQPVQPQLYAGQPDKVAVCLLAVVREYYQRPNFTITDREFVPALGQSTTTNVKNHNNIATRNFMVENLNLADKPAVKYVVDIAQAESDEMAVDIQFITERVINKHFAGNFSAVASVTFQLGELYSRWQSGGGIGTGFSVSDTDSLLTWDGNGEMVLNNVLLQEGERFPVGIVIELKPGVMGNSSHLLHLRQYPTGENREEIPYGNVSFKIDVEGEEEEEEEDMDKPGRIAKTVNHQYLVFPTPAGEQLYVERVTPANEPNNVRLLDMSGRVLMTSSMNVNEQKISFSTNHLASGFYLIEVQENNGNTERYKVVVQ